MKLYAKTIGILFTVIGLLSLTPLKGADGLLFGIFQVHTILQTLLHLATGIGALVLAFRADGLALGKYVKIYGIAYLIVALLGLGGLAQGITSYSSIVGLIYLNLPTELLYIVTGVWGIYAGFFAKDIEILPPN